MKKTLSTLLILICAFTLSATTKKSRFTNHTIYKKVKSDEGTKIKLILGDKTFDIQSYSFGFYPASNEKDKAAAANIYQNNLINVNIRVSKIDQELLDWLLNADQQPKDGQIIVYDADTNKELRKITFTGVKTGAYNENYNNTYTTNSQTTNINLRYKTISVKL